MSRQQETPNSKPFEEASVADGYDEDIVRHLPWHPLVSKAIAHFGQHYIGTGLTSLTYDIGSATGSLTKLLLPIARERKSRLIAIEPSEEMRRVYLLDEELRLFTGLNEKSAFEYRFEPFDFATLFLVNLYLPPSKRGQFLSGLRKKMRTGGALVVVDKIQGDGGYLGTAIARLSFAAKQWQGVSNKDIMEREMSFCGVQRPSDPALFADARQFFQFGEFAGWIFTKDEETDQ